MWSGPGCDERIDRIHPEQADRSAPCGHALLDTGPLCLAVAGMTQEGELCPCHDDDRPRTGGADRVTDRRDHRHRNTLVDGYPLSQFLRPEPTTSCRRLSGIDTGPLLDRIAEEDHLAGKPHQRRTGVDDSICAYIDVTRTWRTL
jgi:hypothetical protein